MYIRNFPAKVILTIFLLEVIFGKLQIFEVTEVVKICTFVKKTIHNLKTVTIIKKNIMTKIVHLNIVYIKHIDNFSCIITIIEVTEV